MYLQDQNQQKVSRELVDFGLVRTAFASSHRLGARAREVHILKEK